MKRLRDWLAGFAIPITEAPFFCPEPDADTADREYPACCCLTKFDPVSFEDYTPIGEYPDLPPQAAASPPPV